MNFSNLRNLFTDNLSVLAQSQPLLANEILNYSDEPSFFTVNVSKSGVPTLRFTGGGIDYHSPEDPVEEAKRFIKDALRETRIDRVFSFGFGLGYHVHELVNLDFSPVVYDTDIGILRAAFKSLDLREILPYINIHTSHRYPNIPPKSKVIFHPVASAIFALDAAKFTQKIPELPPATHDLVEGLKCESYRNVLCMKDPIALVCYQMIISLVRPDVIIEIGTCRGGSAYLLVDFLKLMGGDRKVITIDVYNDVAPEVYEHSNITFIPFGHREFDTSIIKTSDRVLVIDDSSHTYENTLEVLNRFGSIVSPNSYFIVEDTAADGPTFNGGPMRAVKEFLSTNPPFERDMRWEHFFGPGWEGDCVFLRKKI